MAFYKDDDYTYEEEQLAPEYHPVWRVLGYTLKYGFWALIVLVNGLIFWRMFASGNPASMKTLYVTDPLAAAYAEEMADGELDDAFAVRTLGLENMTLDDPDEDKGIKGNYGYFGYTDAVYFPSVGQTQIVFRYNDSTLKHLKEDYGLDFDPSKKEDWYVVRLRAVTKDGTVTIDPAHTDRANKPLYTYYRFVYEDLPAEETVKELYIDVYYKDDVDPTNPYGTLCVYSRHNEARPYDLDRRDRKALKEGAAQ